MRTAEEIIAWAIDSYGAGGELALSTSLQKGGMVVLHMALQQGYRPRVLTLDTGRLPEETFSMMEAVRKAFGIAVETISPDAGETERMVAQHGPNLFYRDRPSRLLCCQVRKVRPLERKLKGFSAILTGLRRDQAETREALEQVEDLESPVKINPLAYWAASDVDAYTLLHGLPIHPLYHRGYTSIGCAPCTRPPLDGGTGLSDRSGRWWWEDGDSKECGLHFTPEGQLKRTVDILLDDILTHA